MQFLRTAFLLFLLSVFISYAFPQENSSKQTNKQEETRIVKINLMVLDSANQFADDVKIEDVKVFENGIEQKITSFTKTPSTLNIGLVIDNTGSMRKSLEQVISQSKTLIANLKQTDEAFIIRFVDSDKIQVIQDWTSDKEQLNEALDTLYVEAGQSAVIDAVFLSAEKLLEREKKNKSKKYALFIISDGEDRDSYYKNKELLALFDNSDIQVFMLSYAADAPLKPKKAAKFADEIFFRTGGVKYDLQRKSGKNEIIAALKSLVTELRSNYIFTYNSTIPPGQKSDNLSRKINVQISDNAKGEKRQAFVRENIFVPKN
ncbi:MAG TPA: VWA domain-containing protein [Pyrinomonadaceae bacterium]